MSHKKDVCRCTWPQIEDPLYTLYHDEEWGVPIHDDNKHFEFLILEGAQAGLSWLTILRRRENYRKAFARFDPKKVAAFSEKTIEELLKNEGIIRNRLKIRSTVENAKHFLKIQEEWGSFDNYVWSFVNHKPIQNRWNSLKEVPCETKESLSLSKDLKKRGFNFVGPTIMYAYMQATGLVNDHIIDCFRHKHLNDE